MINIFLHVRRDAVQAQPEEILAWLRALKPQHDGRIYLRISEYKAQFGERTDVLYELISALARRGLIEVERWRLERMAPPKQKRGSRRLSPSWDPVELLYVVTAVNLDVTIQFECYMPETVKQKPLSPEERYEIWMAAECRCSYCNKAISLELMTVDHDIPRSRGGGHDPENLVSACHACNTAKRARTGDEYRAILASIDSLQLVSPSSNGVGRG